jgi:PPIC-type PPIASE domain
VRFLIQARWYELEAKAKGLSPQRIPHEQLVGAAAHSGIAVRDIEAVARARQLRVALVPDATTPAKAPTFSDERVAAYYAAHRRHYDLVSRRYVDALVAPTRGLARRVATAFQAEPSSAELLKRFQDEGATRPYDGRLIDVGSSERDALRRVAGSLDVGDVRMIKVPDGWYVFRLITISPRRPHPLEAARSQVEQELYERWVRERYEAYNRELRDRYKEDTTCAEQYELPECK